MHIAVFGLGYGGSVTAACLADLGHKVIGVDVAEDKVRAVDAGHSPIIEPGLDSLMSQARKKGALSSTTSVTDAVAGSELAFICVGTPSDAKGALDSLQVSRVVRDLALALEHTGKRRYRVFNRSTCLPDLHEGLRDLLRQRTVCNIEYIVHPEFIREGSAIHDFQHPPLIVYGGDCTEKSSLTEELYPEIQATSHYLSLREAALVKYASNIFHAVKITFANEIGMLSNTYRVDARKVMEVVCEDHILNISSRYLRPGMPFGGSCLPKDLMAVLCHTTDARTKLPMFSSVLSSNKIQIEALMERFANLQAKRVALLGLAFKNGTDDLRNSPMLMLVKLLLEAGVEVVVWDPCIVLEKLTGANLDYFKEMIGPVEGLMTTNINHAVTSADVIVLGQELDQEILTTLELRPEQTLLDLVGCAAAEQITYRYEGVYWNYGE